MTPELAAERALDHILAPLAALLADHTLSEIMINAPDQIWIERNGQLARSAAILPEGAVAVVARLIASLSTAVSLEHDATLEGAWRGWRVTAVLPPVAREQSCLCLRRHRVTPLPLGDWRAGAVWRDDPGALQPGLPTCLHQAIAGRYNILVSGSTGAGKTTLLASLLAQIGADQRVVCLEDTPELPQACPHQVRLLTRRGHSLRSLLRLALRLRPDRLVVGEVRGAEAFDLLQAMATGHAGCLGTIHAPDTRGALARLEQLILTAGLDWPLDAVRAQIAQWLRVLVHVSRDAKGRCVSELHVLQGVEHGRFSLREIPLA
jgi:pilus assembly protein CpaF